MKNLGKIIITLIIFIIVMIVAIIFNIIATKNKEEVLISREGELHTIDGVRETMKITSFQLYFQLDNCVSTFIEYVNNKNLKAIKSILINDYIQQKYGNDNIDLHNYKNIMKKKYTIKDIYSLDATYEKPYFIRGELINENEIESMYFVVFLDVENNTFSIKDITEEEYQQMISGNFQFKEISIIENEYNKIKKTYFSEEDMAKKYFYDYIENIVYAPTYAYKTLNKKYEEKRFGNYSVYKEYLKSNIEIYKIMEQNRSIARDEFGTEEEYNEYLKKKFYSGFYKYKVNKYEDYTQYICMDFNNNYYIFNVLPDFSYSVILDTYTIDFPQFVEKYNKSNIQERIVMNIDRFIKSLNDKNYKYAYNCLADVFKNNKFNNVEVFESFIRQNIFEKNIVEYIELKNEGETYIYNIILKDEKDDTQSKKMQIIMKLGDGTDFKMSFNIK